MRGWSGLGAAQGSRRQGIGGGFLCLFLVQSEKVSERRLSCVGSLHVIALTVAQVYGPHIAILYASRQAQQNLGSLGHYFHTGTSLETKIGLASASYELVAAIPSIVSYFGPDKSETWAAIASHEEKLQEGLLSYLRKREDVTIHGERSANKDLRVPVISFTVHGRSSRDIVEGIERRSNFGCRWGHFYSKRMVDDLLGLEGCDGVVRVSMVHYNTGELPGEHVLA